MKKITVIGIGNGGFAVAADMALAGHKVTLFANEKYIERIEEIVETKAISLSGVGRNGVAKLYNVTSNYEEALSDVDLIMPVLPAYALEDFAEEFGPYLKKGHRIMLTPGSTGGALLVAKKLHELGKINDIIIGEMHTLPYACRKTGPNSVNILLECKKLYVAAFPAKYNNLMYDMIKCLYPSAELVKDVLESSLNNGNPVSHPAPVVLNAGKIEYAFKNHYHYKEGITPSVANVVQKIDDERKRICEELDYIPLDVKDRLYKMGYAPKRKNLYESYRDSEVFTSLIGPNNLDNRYLTEDTPYSLVALASLGDVVGVDTPAMDSVITLAAILKGEDYWNGGNTVDKLGFEGMDLDEIKEFLENGY